MISFFRSYHCRSLRKASPGAHWDERHDVTLRKARNFCHRRPPTCLLLVAHFLLGSIQLDLLSHASFNLLVSRSAPSQRRIFHGEQSLHKHKKEFRSPSILLLAGNTGKATLLKTDGGYATEREVAIAAFASRSRAYPTCVFTMPLPTQWPVVRKITRPLPFSTSPTFDSPWLGC